MRGKFGFARPGRFKIVSIFTEDSILAESMKFITVSEPPVHSSFNFYRKLYHLLGLFVPLIFYLGVFDRLGPGLAHPTRAIGFCVLLFGIGLLLLVDVGRFYWAAFRDLFYKVLGPLMKEEERHRINASVPYFLANLILFALAGREVTVIACIYLMIGDPVAAYVGGRFGRVRFWNGKSLEGMLGFAVAGTAGALLFLTAHTLRADPGDPLALLDKAGAVRWQIPALVTIGATGAAMIEFFAFNRFKGLWDDNLSVPLGGAIGLAFCAFYFFGIPGEFLFFPPAELFAPAVAVH